MRDFCGVFGIYSFSRKPELAKLAYFALFALQHRGQECAGIAAADGTDIKLFKKMGLVNQVFNEENLKNLDGHLAIGHVRYSTTGSSVIENAQPVVMDTKFGPIAIAHNGNLVNTDDLKNELKGRGLSFIGTTDSEVIAALISTSKEEVFEQALLASLSKLQGAFSIVIITRDKLFAFRDPQGIRPLCLGKVDDAYVFASETCALDIIGARFLREVGNGEMVVVEKEGLRSKTWSFSEREAMCIFEHIYFARPDSVLHGHNVYQTRVALGKYLASEYPVDADMVIGVPESGVPAAIGFAEESKIPYGEGLIKNRYVGRTFIQPSQEIRELGVRLKLNPIGDALRGKKVVVVDDSIVRGTSSRQIVKILRDAGAREVHFRISSPPIIGSCFYGIDTPTRAELIAANLSIEGIRKYIDADTLGYLSVKSMIRAVGLPEESVCLACFNGNYPVRIPEKLTSLNLLFDKGVMSDVM
ncbi:MAG: amidophosphoribosyltransferase [Candidatus Saganbacteria bacterium]|nr:amidophosphoribosyltransferase [Candidatus Saganbacteria bacterium]